MNSSAQDMNNSGSGSGLGLSRRSSRLLQSPLASVSVSASASASVTSSNSSQRSTGSNSSSNNRGGGTGTTSSNSKNTSTHSSPRSSRRSVTPPKSRREFWGLNQSRRRMLPNNSQHSGNNCVRGSGESVGSVGSLDPMAPSSAGMSSMYHLFSADFKDMIGSDAVQRVLKLMFSSMAVVFQETQVIVTATNSHHVSSPFVYTRIPSIPASAARMLWNELMGGISLNMNNQGCWTIDLDKSSNVSPDPCLSKIIIESFVNYVNSGKDPIQKKQKEKGFWGKIRNKANPNKQNNDNDDHDHDDDEKASERRCSGKDPFLYFIRDALTKTGFLELAGRRVDDEEEEEIDDTDEDEPVEEEPHDAHNNDDDDDDYDDDDDDLHASGDIQDSTVDFSGWDQRKKKIRAQSRTQYFQIYKDMQFQYGVYLSSTPLAEGGFAILNSTNPDDASDTGSVAVREHDTMKRWNDAMSNACWTQLVEAKVIETHRGAAQNAEDEAWTLSRKLNPFDDAVSYAIQMYPTHLMRCGRVVEGARMLMLPKFFLARLSSMDPFEAVNRHRANLEEMTQRSIIAAEGGVDLGGDGNAIEPKDITLAAINVMMKTLKERYPILSGGGTSTVKGEREAGEVGRSLHLIAAFLGERDHTKLSMDIYDLCLKYKIAALGQDHASVGRTWRHMGHQYMNQYSYDDAVGAYSESVRIERLQDSIEYRHVILALNSMAMIYGMTGRPKKAVDNYSQSLAIQKTQLGESNIQVAETLNSMGIVYGMMCKFDSAIECYSEALYIKIRKLGEDHEDVADVYFNLGLVHKRHGEHDSAINVYQKALRIRKDQLGEEHEDVARVLHHIGVVLSDMGEIGDAQLFYEECLRIRRLVLGDEHEEVARTLHNLGLVCYDGGEYDRALECLEDAVELGRKKVGKRSEKVADSLHSIGLVYQKLANFKDAIHSYEDAVKIRRKRLGNDHLEVAATLHNMGDVYYMMGDLEHAMDTYEEAYVIRLAKLGTHHVDVAATHNNMGVVLMKKGEHNDAMACFAAALTIREKNLGPDHEKCSDTLHNMGLVHKNLKEYDQAIGRYEQALTVRRMQLGENDMKVADTLYNMAIVYANTSQYAKALERYKEALRTYRETGMSDDHPSVVNTLQWIKWAQKKLSKASRRDIYAS